MSNSSTPTFLVDTLFRRRVNSLALDGMVGSAALLSTFDVDDMPTEALLFQTGYLTIVRPEPRGGSGGGSPHGMHARSRGDCVIRPMWQGDAGMEAASGTPLVGRW